jgi:Holliday junction resolvase-like predicted endonuclease
VKELVEHVNKKLANESIAQSQKLTLTLLLEHWLHETGNYAGYNCNFDYNGVSEEYKNCHEYDRHYYYKG